MNRQVNVLLALAGAAALLLGCTQDPVGTAPGGLEPSASSQRGDDRGDTGTEPGGDASSSSGAQSGDSDDSDSGGDSSGSN